MRRAISWFLAGMPFDALSRRAIDETLLDWDREVTEAKTLAEVTGAEIHGGVSILRVTSLSILRESIDLSWCRGLGRRFGIFVAVVVLPVLLLTAFGIADLGIYALAVGVTVSASLVTSYLPAALVLIVAWRPLKTDIPTVGAALVAAMVAAVLTGWLLPLSSEWVVEATDRLLRSLAPPNELPLRPPLGPVPWSPWAVAGQACLAGASMTLAAVLANRTVLRSRWWVVGIPIGYMLAFAVSRMAIGVFFLELDAREWLSLADGIGMLALAAGLFWAALRLRGVPHADQPA